MAKRSRYDLSHFDFKVGDIGKLQTLTVIPILAGDSVGVNMEGVFRLSPLRRNLVVDCQVELFAFYVPHRHVYGEQWIQWIKDGLNRTTGPFTPGGPAPADGLSYLGTEIAANGDFPLWLSAGYNQIWNRYFRSPTDDARERDDDFLADNLSERVSGYSCGHMPTAWSTGTVDAVPETEREVPVNGSLDIVDLNKVQAAYSTEVDRQFFGQRYTDILNTTWGSRVNTDADQRPTLIARNKFWLSGYDVDGTGDANLGSYSGKSVAVGGLRFRRRYFAEHGALRIMALLRFPPIHTQERLIQLRETDMEYRRFGGDAAVMAAEEPEEIFQSHWFRDDEGGSNSLGFGPFGNMWRYQVSNVHKSYQTLDGFTFLDLPINSQERAHYIANDEYDDVFQTLQLRQWQSHARINVDAMRCVPPARHSLYAGA